MDRIKLRMVKDAEAYLAGAKAYLEELEERIRATDDLVERKKLLNQLEQNRITYSQYMADIVIFKAQFGIFTDPEEYNTKRIK